MVACAAIIGWPFSALVGVPLAVDILFTKGIFFAAGHGLLSLLYFLVPSILVDTFYYGKVTSSVWNIIDYNVISKNLHGGSELYGVEPTHFYLFNGFLNFNIALPLALLALPVCIL
jgi:alpha-1,2-mannosyltransferase